MQLISRVSVVEFSASLWSAGASNAFCFVWKKSVNKRICIFEFYQIQCWKNGFNCVLKRLKTKKNYQSRLSKNISKMQSQAIFVSIFCFQFFTERVVARVTSVSSRHNHFDVARSTTTMATISLKEFLDASPSTTARTQKCREGCLKKVNASLCAGV